MYIFKTRKNGFNLRGVPSKEGFLGFFLGGCSTSQCIMSNCKTITVD